MDDSIAYAHVNEALQDAYALLAGISKTDLARFVSVVYDQLEPK